MDSQADLWTEVLKHYLKFGRLCWIYSREVSGTMGRQSWSKYRFGSMLLEEKTDALPSAPGGSAF
jgi:hypothetical protein